MYCSAKNRELPAVLLGRDAVRLAYLASRRRPIFVVILYDKVKVKYTLVQVLRLCTGRTAHRGSRGIAVPFHDHGTRRG